MELPDNVAATGFTMDEILKIIDDSVHDKKNNCDITQYCKYIFRYYFNGNVLAADYNMEIHHAFIDCVSKMLKDRDESLIKKFVMICEFYEREILLHETYKSYKHLKKMYSDIHYDSHIEKIKDHLRCIDTPKTERDASGACLCGSTYLYTQDLCSELAKSIVDDIIKEKIVKKLEKDAKRKLNELHTQISEFIR